MKRLLLIGLAISLGIAGWVGFAFVCLDAYSSPIVERSFPQYIASGEWFTVEITFTCPEDETNSIGIADNLEGFTDVQGDVDWCEPQAFSCRVLGGSPHANMVEYVWADVFQARTEVKAIYQVKLVGTPMDEFTFADSFAAYYVGAGVSGEKHILVELPVESVKIKPDQSYTLGVINQWLYDNLTMSEALSVINAWIS